MAKDWELRGKDVLDVSCLQGWARSSSRCRSRKGIGQRAASRMEPVMPLGDEEAANGTGGQVVFLEVAWRDVTFQGAAGMIVQVRPHTRVGAPPSGCCRRMARASGDWAEDSSGGSRGGRPLPLVAVDLHGRAFATHWCTRQGWAGVGSLTNAMSSLWPAGPTGVPVEELPGAAMPFDGKSGGKMTLAVCVWGRLLVDDATPTPVQRGWEIKGSL